MTREEYIKRLIYENGMTIKSFAQSIDMPYSTLLSMLGGSLGGAAVDNVIRICRGLGITISDLQAAVASSDQGEAFPLTEGEKRLVRGYREHPEMRPAVDRLLELDGGA